ncbi:MAG: DHA2 family efflux MFS transporter permease subunit [Bacillus sp. (in: firmicutes)]
MIAILFVGAFVAFLNNTLLNIALPTLMEEFDVGTSTVQWLTNGFMLVSGVLVPTSAFFITRFTNRKLFISAMSIFTIGTAVAAFAPEFWVLIVARMVQAAGMSMLGPLLMNVMLTSFPIEKRGAAMGIFGLVMISAPAIGPTLSGWILEHYTWRVLFGMILPLSVLTVILAIFKLKNVTPNKKAKLDVLSVILSSIGFGGILYGFTSAGTEGWDAPITYGTLIIGGISLVAFIIRQLRLQDPLLEFRAYKYPMFALGSVISVVLSMAMFSGMILTPLYTQTIRGISPLDSGLLMLPGALVMGIMSPITGRLFDKYGARMLAITGLSIMAVSTYYLTDLTTETSYTYLMAVYTIRMFGMSMVMMPISTNGLNQLPMNYYPHGTAINNTLQQISGAIGTALLMTVMNHRTEETAESLMAEAMSKAAESGQAAQMTEEAMAAMQQQIGMQALLDGINHTFFVAMIIGLIPLVLAFFVKRSKAPSLEKAASPSSTTVPKEEQFNH